MGSLDELDKLVTGNTAKPTDVEFIYYLFWEKGISWEEFNNLPLPYIFAIIKCHTYVKNEEEKAYKKANKKR